MTPKQAMADECRRWGYQPGQVFVKRTRGRQIVRVRRKVFRRLRDDFDMDSATIAKTVGWDRSSVDFSLASDDDTDPLPPISRDEVIERLRQPLRSRVGRVGHRWEAEHEFYRMGYSVTEIRTAIREAKGGISNRTFRSLAKKGLA